MFRCRVVWSLVANIMKNDVMVHGSSAPCLASLLASSFPNIFESALIFFHGDVMT